MMTTFTGLTVNPFDLEPDDIQIEDIAHALACVNRFNGMAAIPISVAIHSFYVSKLVSRKHALQGLLHDAAEAYICDVTKWVKKTTAFTAYRELEKDIQERIFIKFGCDADMHPSVKEADDLMVRFEARESFTDFNFGGMSHLYPPITRLEKDRIRSASRNEMHGYEYFSWTVAKAIFSNRFLELTNEFEDQSTESHQAR